MKFLIKPTCGLANRLRAIDSAVAFARKCKRTLEVYWYDTPDCHASWSDLFESPAGFTVVDVPAADAHKYDWVFSRKNPSYVAPCPNVTSERETIRDCLVREDQDLAMESYHSFYAGSGYDWLRASAQVMQEVNRLRAIMGEDVIGIHIRRSDMPIATLVSHTDLFIERIRSEIARDPHVRFLLASDDNGEKDQLLRMFPGTVVSRNNVAGRFGDGGIKDALIDLLLLASCKKIIGTICSSFGTEAAHIGNITKQTLDDKSRVAVSFVVRVESYSSPDDVRKCLESLNNQWFKRNEILCVCGGQASPEVLAEIRRVETKSPRFMRVYDEGEAIQRVRGKYLLFVSSSEVASFELAKRVFNAAEAAQADQVVFRPASVVCPANGNLEKSLNGRLFRWISWKRLNRRVVPPFIAALPFIGCRKGLLAPYRQLFRTDVYKRIRACDPQVSGVAVAGRAAFLDRQLIRRVLTSDSIDVFKKEQGKCRRLWLFPLCAKVFAVAVRMLFRYRQEV